MIVEVVFAVVAVAGVGLSLEADAAEEADRKFDFDLHVDQALAVAAQGRWEP